MTQEPPDKPKDTDGQEERIETDTPKEIENNQEEYRCRGEEDPEGFLMDMYVANRGLATENDFWDSLAAFECTQAHEDDSVHEIILRGEATKLLLGLQRLERIEKAILINHRPAALERLVHKAFGPGKRLSGDYFGDPDYKEEVDKHFEAGGFAPEAVEGQAYLEAMPSLSVIHRQKAADRKALFKILTELEARRARLTKKNAEKSTPKPEDD